MDDGGTAWDALSNWAGLLHGLWSAPRSTLAVYGLWEEVACGILPLLP